MRLARAGRCVAAWAPAKLNLFLELLGKRPDGYHELRTVMTTIAWHDRIEVRPHREGVRLRVEGLPAPADPSNTMWRAAEALRKWAHLRSGVDLRLVKRVPAGTGLGSASSDAAAVLLSMNELFRLGATRDELATVAAMVGSDVAFFLWGGLALCEGRGEKVTPLVGRPPGRFVIAVPATPNSTAAVYARCRVPRRPRPAEPILAALAEGRGVERHLFNRLGAVAERLNPETRAWRKRLGPGAIVTGSGSAVYRVWKGGRPRPVATRVVAVDSGG